MAGINHLYESYNWHKRQLENHLRREPFQASLVDEQWTRNKLQQISDRIVEKGGTAPEPVSIADEVHGMDVTAADRWEDLGQLVELNRRQEGARLEASHGGDDVKEGRRRELEQRWEALAGQVTAAYDAGEPGAETGAQPMAAERELDSVTIQLMSGIYEPEPSADTGPEPEPEAEI